MPRFGDFVAGELRLVARRAGGKAVGEVAAGERRAVDALLARRLERSR